MPKETWTLLTPPNMGAIAIIQLPSSALPKITNKTEWKIGKLYLVAIPDIDEAVAVKVTDEYAHIMPHGGMQILRKLAALFADLGLVQTETPTFLETQNAIEAAMLTALSIAQSPLAVDLLLSQPANLEGATRSEEDFSRAAILNHLIHPPKVVLLGAPNTGKSTLMNALTKQDTSIVHDLPGATRDAVGARINCAGLVVDLYDLPGFRDTSDSIEQEAITLAKQIAADAILTILIADAAHDWEESTQDHLKVATKSDVKIRDDADVCVSAHTGENLQELAIAIRDAIVPPEMLQSDKPWFFSGYSPTEE
ncbi:MAG: 50S ribosome-binding GTPase [Planctomycetes bacterium]|nr:50S ribosome-binding GTPase [Planctomycetota bacterium]